MTSTAQEQTQIGGEQTQQQPPAQPETSTPAAPRSNSREYTLFEEARTDTWTQIGKVEADTQEAALESLGEQKLKEPKRFMAIPSRFAVPRKPKVDTVTTISFD